MYALYLALAALFASAGLGQGTNGLPSCAASCVTGYGNCGQFDVACICSDKSYIAHLSCCVSKSCDAAEQNATLTFANALCAGQNVTDLPQTATCASTAASGSTSAATVSGSSSAMTTSGATTTTTATSGGSASSASAASSSSSPAAAVMNMNTMGSLGFGALLAGIVAAL